MQNRDIFSILFNMKVYCVFSLESPHRGEDPNRYTQYIYFNMKKKITLNYPKSALKGFFQETQKKSSKQSCNMATNLNLLSLITKAAIIHTSVVAVKSKIYKTP